MTSERDAHPTVRSAGIALPLLLFVAGVAVMVVRRPEYFTSPGFWAEEGAFYFAGAWRTSWVRGLVARPIGYFSLWPNVAVVLAAHLVPLANAPLVTTLMALLVQALPLALIAFGRAPEWDGPSRKALGMAIVLFASLTGEIWLNTINCQFHLCLLAALLLLEPAVLSSQRTTIYAGLLALAGLTGPGAAALAPLFVLRAREAKTHGWRALASVAITCALVQGLATWSAGPLLRLPERQGGLGVATAGLIVWMKTLVLPVLGVDAAHGFVRTAAALVGGPLDSPRARAVGMALLAAAAGTIGALAWRLSPRTRVALAGGYVLLTAAAVFGGIGERRMFLGHADNSSRYFYAPGALLLFLLMANAVEGEARGSALRLASAAFLAAGLVLGVARYRASLRWQPSWPRWRAEVAAWERDPAHPLAIWPPPRWTMSLPRSP